MLDLKMPQTIAGARNNEWLQYLKACGERYRAEKQQDKAQIAPAGTAAHQAQQNPSRAVGKTSPSARMVMGKQPPVHGAESTE